MEASGELSFVSILLPLVGIVFLIALVVVLLNQQFQKNLLKQQMEKEALKHRHERNLLNKAIQVQEKERKRFANDLHDELGASLSISRMRLLQLEREKERNTDFFNSELRHVRNAIESSLVSTRRISHDLMPIMLKDNGLVYALTYLVDRIEKAQTLNFELDFPEDLSDLSWEVELGLYRICSELLNNTIKHAEAQKVLIKLKMDLNQLLFHYEDDGKGIPSNKKETGLGLTSIESRVKSLDGTLEWGNGKLGGFKAKVLLELRS